MYVAKKTMTYQGKLYHPGDVMQFGFIKPSLISAGRVLEVSSLDDPKVANLINKSDPSGRSGAVAVKSAAVSAQDTTQEMASGEKSRLVDETLPSIAVQPIKANQAKKGKKKKTKKGW